MQDPKITIRGILSSAWNLSGDLATANISFTTGWYDRKFGNLQISVTAPQEDDSPEQLGMSSVRTWARYNVDVWVKAQNATNKGVGKAKDYLWDMKEEVKRIFKANKTGLTNIDWLLPGDGVEVPEPDQVPPMLHWHYEPVIGYTQ